VNEGQDGLYIVDEDGKIISDKEKLIERNKLILKSPIFNIYKLIFFNETEEQNEMKIYVVTKKVNG